MKILVSPNSFKGSCSAGDMAMLIAENLCRLKGFDVSALDITMLPVADGGDDTLDVLRQAQPDRWRQEKNEVMGVIPKLMVSVPYLVSLERSQAVVEAAKAHGIALLAQSGLPLDALGATSYGVGQLLNLIKTHSKEVIVTLGGSASTDGGAGALQAMGVVFLDADQHPMEEPLTPQHFPKIRSICRNSVQKLLSHWNQTFLTILTDVKNPLLGKNGTAHTFAAQKGADERQRQYLESGLERLATMIGDVFSTDHCQAPGAGAAGGLAYGLMQLPNARIQSGFEWLSHCLHLEANLTQVDCVITGEGCFDRTSCQGKATGELLALAARHQKKVILICGAVDHQVLASFQHTHILVLAITDVVSQHEAITEPKIAIQRLLSHYADDLVAFLARPV